jgi:hypothetical protein
MKPKLSVRSLAILLVLMSVFLSAAAPGPLPASAAKPAEAGDLVRLTVTNRTENTLKIWLDGPAFYYLTVPPLATEVFTPQRGEYKSSIFACGITVRETLDLTSNRRIIQPVCGGGDVPAAAETYTIDLGQISRIVRVNFENNTRGTITLVLTGPATYVLTLPKDAKNEYTIRKGSYDVTLYAYGCGLVTSTKFTASAQAKKVFKCP